MTRKDYIKIAEVLKEVIGMDLVQEKYNSSYHRDKIIEKFCRMLKSDNNRFDSDRFKNYIKGVK